MLEKEEGHTPLYIHLADIIKKRIDDKKYREGHAIPSEMTLQEEFKLSRTTVRKALKLLSDQNILIKLPGKGTYVSDQGNEVKTQNHHFSSLTDSVKKAGKTMSTRLISVQEVPGQPEQRSFLQLQDDEQLIEIKRLRYIDEVPFCVEWIWLPPKFAGIKKADLDSPLYQLLKKNFMVSPSTGKKTFKITFATREESFLLNVDEKTALMQIKDFVYDNHNLPMHISQQVLRSDKFTYAIDH